MTSPFDWRNQPSGIGKALEADVQKGRNAASKGKGWAATGNSMHLNEKSLAPKKFHVYSKARPGGK